MSKTNKLQITYTSQSEDCGIVLYDRFSGEELGRYAFSKDSKIGNAYHMTLPGFSLQKVSYLFYEGNRLIIDKKAVAFAGADTFGSAKNCHQFRSTGISRNFCWEGDTLPKLAYEDSIGYCLHVRGFTIHATSKVKAKGTFTGIVEKIPYLKELGITTLELQPAYEFCERPVSYATQTISPQPENNKVNYWGYEEGYYYTPKRAYAHGKDASEEFKDMVKALHKNRMEVIMQFYFPDHFSRLEILPILRFWHLEYHVDGFHIKGRDLPARDIAKDAYLCDAKLWYDNFPIEEIYTKENPPAYKRLALYNDAYLYNVRGFLKGDKNALKPAMESIFQNPSYCGVVKYLSNYYGFTMADMVCYQEKHNEANGEENRDGTNYHCSWNCGVEGTTRKKQVKTLRKLQFRNAFALLFLSQGMPLIFMGDEFANSQIGNNNPYCQDNEMAWLNWKDVKSNQDTLEYVKNLIRLRKEIRVFSASKFYEKTDYLSLGVPDLSYHDEEAWKYIWEEEKNHIGFLLNGDYVNGCKDSYWYVAVNMHWEKQTLVLPPLHQTGSWTLYFSTDTIQQEDVKQDLLIDYTCHINPRSISVFYCKK